eukprot:Opistho-1_new@32051
MADHVGVVAVVARVGTKLRRAGIQVTDLQVEAHHEAGHAQHGCADDSAGGPASFGEQIEEGPEAMLARRTVARIESLGAQAALRGRSAHACVGQQHRQQHEVGEHQHADAEAGRDREVLDHRDADHHQHRKTHRVGQQRRESGQEQAAKGQARRDQLPCATADVLHDPVHLLCAMAHADREDEERHEDRVRIQGEAEQRQQSEQPHYGNQRTDDDQQSAAHAARVPVQHRGADRDRDGEEHQHLAKSIDQVAGHLREADDVDVDALGLVLRTQLLELAVHALVVEWRTGRIPVQQRDEQDAGAEVRGHQLADLAGALDVLAQLRELRVGAVEAVGYHRPAVEAVLGDGDPAHRRHVQRLHVGPVHARQHVDLIIEPAQRVEEAWLEDRALPGSDGDAQRVARPGELLFVVAQVLDVWMPARQHALEAGCELQSGGLPAEQQRRRQAQRDDQPAAAEQQPLGKRARARIEGLGGRRGGDGG